MTLISAQAALEASSSAMMKQAEGATEQCKKLLDENEQLRVSSKGAPHIYPPFIVADYTVPSSCRWIFIDFYHKQPL